MSDPLLFLQDLMVILLSAAIAGALCRRLGLSPVLGYISAGLIVGTPEIVFPYVTDRERISIIAQLGVVFLMFSIGLQFGLKKIREIGFRIVFSTILAALLVFSAVRLSAELMGLSVAAAIALAGVFMNSSSAIISKVVDEIGIGHERRGRLAMATTLLEDIVSVVMLAVLGSYLAIGSGGAEASPLLTMGAVAAFATAMIVLGILLLPKILRRAGGSGGTEASTLWVAGLVLLAAIVAVKSGYSLALGAFLCGMVVAETRQRANIERSFSGLKDIFLTVFFVTIGMMVDVHAIPSALGWIGLAVLGAILGRALAAFVALSVVGEHPRTALQAALCVTPLGEFSFVIAGVAVAGGVFGETFQVAVVGAVLGTCLVSPLLAARSGAISNWLLPEAGGGITRLHLTYADFWMRLSLKAVDPLLWKLLRKRILQISVEVLLVSAALSFANAIFLWLSGLQPTLTAHPAAAPLFWITLGVVLLVPLVAIWRNLSAVAMLLADYFTSRNAFGRKRALILEALLRLLFGLILAIWLWNVLPGELARVWLIVAVATVGGPMLLFQWRKIIRLHSEVESLLNENLASEQNASASQLFDEWKKQSWNLNVSQIILPDDSRWAGMTLKSLALRKRTGCSVVGLQRHGFTLFEIGPRTQIFPGDELLLLGSENQIDACRRLLDESATSENSRNLESLILRSTRVPEGDGLTGKSLGELNLTHRYGIQIVALRRNDETITALDGDTRIAQGDHLLLLGAARRLERFHADTH